MSVAAASPAHRQVIAASPGDRPVARSPPRHPPGHLRATIRTATIFSEGIEIIEPAQSAAGYCSITIDRDTGPTIQIATGLDGTERVVKLANAELSEGVTVEVLRPQEKPEKP